MLNYDLVKDEELVILANEGDSKAMDVLTLRYIPIAKIYAAKYNINHLEKCDLVQEGIIGFLSGVYSYKNGSVASFSTFASCCIRNRIISVVRSALSQKHIPDTMLVPLEEHSDSADIQPTPEELLMSEKEAEYISQIIKDCLSQQEQKVFNLYLKGFSYEQMAKKADLSMKAVDSTMQRARRKLREKLSFYK